MARWTAEQVREAVEAGDAESRTLDWKQTLPPTSDKGFGAKDFATDVVAMLNSQGGSIIYGVEERRDDEGKLTGEAAGFARSLGSVDESIRKLTHWAAAHVDPRPPPLQIYPLDGPNGPIVVVDVPQSWTGPHMVRTGASQFYRRGPRSNEPLDCEQIREAFAMAGTIQQRMRQFVDERTRALAGGPYVALHLVSSAFGSTGAPRLDPRQVTDNEVAKNLPLIGGFASNWRLNIDGILLTAGKSYCAQLFRQGAIETCVQYPATPQKQINFAALEQQIVKVTPRLLRTLQELGARFPVYSSIRAGVPHGGTPYIYSSFPAEADHCFDRQQLITDEGVFERPDSDPAAVYRDAFDTLWQAAGYNGSPNYNSDTGAWEPAPWAKP